MIGSSIFTTNEAPDSDAERSSNRRFGLTFAGVGLTIGAAKLWWGEDTWWIWLAGGGVLIALAVTSTQVLAPLNRSWARLSIVLHKILSPVIMLVIFVTTVIPIGLAMRALRKDPLRLRRDIEAATYWIDRKPSGPTPATMKNQF
jgi:hypothetical protein